MELTDRERRIITDLEHQFGAAGPGRATPSPEQPAAGRRVRPRWTVLPAAILGVLLLAGGVLLGVGDAVLLGTLLVVWWLSPLLGKVLRAAGRIVLESFENLPTGPVH